MHVSQRSSEAVQMYPSHGVHWDSLPIHIKWSSANDSAAQDCLKQSNISTTHWQDTATDRSAWRRSIHDGLVLYDDSRRERNATKRARRHAARNATSSASQDAYMCRHCGRTCSSRIGILSHERACNKQKRT